jgi:dihydrofolate reductase
VTLPRLSVFIACSLDGYIATTDGGLDWLELAARPDEDYGYDAFLATVDGVAMGRGTYDHIAHLDPLPFGERPVFVFAHRAPPVREGVTFWQRSPREAAARWSEMGLKRVYIDGGTLISAFLTEGLIDDLSITVAPVLLGAGRPLFHAGSPPIALRLTAVRSWASGLVNLSYVRAGHGG